MGGGGGGVCDSVSWFDQYANSFCRVLRVENSYSIGVSAV